MDVSERGRTAGSRTKELVREAKGGLSKSFLGNFVGAWHGHISNPYNLRMLDDEHMGSDT